MFEKTKQVSSVLGAFLVADAAMVTAVVASFSTELWVPVERATGGLINTTLQANLVMLALVGGGVICGLGRLRTGDIGLLWAKLPRAAAMTALVWTVAQVGGLLAALLIGEALAFQPTFTHYGLAIVLGWLVGQLCGNAQFEEVAFRGFLLPQLYGNLAGWRNRPKARTALAILGSQAVFALIHVPVRLYEGLSLADLPLNLCIVGPLGLLFATIYLLTDNLFFVVGVHALTNEPTALFQTHIPGSELLVGLVAAIIWAWLHRQQAPKTALTALVTPA